MAMVADGPSAGGALSMSHQLLAAKFWDAGWRARVLHEKGCRDGGPPGTLPHVTEATGGYSSFGKV